MILPRTFPLRPLKKTTLFVLLGCFGLLSASDVTSAQKPPAASAKKRVSKVELNAALHEAAKHGSLSKVKDLLQQGAEVNSRGEQSGGWMTPLMVAADQHHPEIVVYLLAHGASINARDSDGNTALHTAADVGSTRVVKILLDKGANYHLKNNYGSTPLWIAIHTAYPSENDSGVTSAKLIRARMAKDKRIRHTKRKPATRRK